MGLGYSQNFSAQRDHVNLFVLNTQVGWDRTIYILKQRVFTKKADFGSELPKTSSLPMAGVEKMIGKSFKMILLSKTEQ